MTVGVVAHPLGNFTVNHLSHISVDNGAVELRYVLDLAEIPTVALEHSLAADGRPTTAAFTSWAATHGAEIESRLDLSVDGSPVRLSSPQTSVTTRAGAAGLHTTYFTATYRGSLPSDAHALTYHDRTESGRLGWKDVVLAPDTDPTHELRLYPNALIGSPRARTSLSATLGPNGIARVAPDASGDVSDTAAPSAARMNDLSDLLSRTGDGPLFLIGVLLLAIGLGALHALEPGHGKTLLAISLVGARATTSQAFILATALTAAHTTGVLALGMIVLFATRWIVPETIYPWITLLSGILVAIVGARALAAEIRRRRPQAHQHPHEHPQAQPHAHDHAHGIGVGDHHHHDSTTDDDEAHARAHAIGGSAPLTFRTAVFAAASGNIAPCPAALVVLLAAISLHRIAFGLTLILAFSIGLAATLTILGVAVVRGAGWLSQRPQFARISRWAPFASAAVIATIGAVMVGEGVVAQGVAAPVPIVAGLTLFAILGYAFTLPHRHSRARSAHA